MGNLGHNPATPRSTQSVPRGEYMLSNPNNAHWKSWPKSAICPGQLSRPIIYSTDNFKLHNFFSLEWPHQTPLKRFLNWFCGYEGHNEETKKAAMEHQRRMAKITSLKQDPRAKIFLNINLVAISCICVSMFVYFSI